jgi:hypothetical protein
MYLTIKGHCPTITKGFREKCRDLRKQDTRLSELIINTSVLDWFSSV